MSVMNRICYCLALLSVICIGCDKDDVTKFYDATVTLKPVPGGGFYMEQDDSTALYATNLIKYPYPDFPEKRALISYTDKKISSNKVAGYKYTYDVTMARIDTTRTQNPVPSLGSAFKDAQAYGDDAIGVFLNNVFPVTMIEDGYLSVSYEFLGSGTVPHTLNLVTNVNPEDPFEVELRHYDGGDAALREYAGMIAFPLKELDTHGDTVTLTLKWHSLATGHMASAQFKYCSRTDWP